jgi:hypothetical protein
LAIVVVCKPEAQRERERERENLQDTYHVQQDQPGSTEACKRLVELENYRINFCSHD